VSNSVTLWTVAHQVPLSMEFSRQLLGRWNREKESKMAVAKRQGRSEDQSEDFRQNKQNKQHSWLSPICIGQTQVEEKT